MIREKEKKNRNGEALKEEWWSVRSAVNMRVDPATTFDTAARPLATGIFWDSLPRNRIGKSIHFASLRNKVGADSCTVIGKAIQIRVASLSSP